MKKFEFNRKEAQAILVMADQKYQELLEEQEELNTKISEIDRELEAVSSVLETLEGIYGIDISKVTFE